MPIRVGSRRRGAAFPRLRTRLGRRLARRFSAPLALATVLICSVGCRVDATVVIDVASNGSGTVSLEVLLDQEATRRWGDAAARLRTDDLESAGWAVTGPTSRNGGSVVTVSKPFRGPNDLAAVIAEVAPPTLLSDWNLEIEDGFGSTTYRLTGTVATAGDLSEFSDGELAAALDGLPVGLTPDELAERLGVSRNALSLTVEAQLPGAAPRRVVVNPGSGTASSEVLNATHIEHDGRVSFLALAAAIVALVAAAVLMMSFRRVGRGPGIVDQGPIPIPIPDPDPDPDPDTALDPGPSAGSIPGPDSARDA